MKGVTNAVKARKLIELKKRRTSVSDHLNQIKKKYIFYKILYLSDLGIFESEYDDRGVLEPEEALVNDFRNLSRIRNISQLSDNNRRFSTLLSTGNDTTSTATKAATMSDMRKTTTKYILSPKILHDPHSEESFWSGVYSTFL
jgi:hypothetical protein